MTGSGKENDFRNSSRPEPKAKVDDPLCGGIVKSVETEIVDDEEYEAIEISLRLAENIFQKNVKEPGTRAKQEVQSKFPESAGDCREKRTPAKCPSVRKAPLQNVQPRLESLLVGTTEYDTVKALFQRTCNNYTVVGIERCTPTLHAPPATRCCCCALAPLTLARLCTPQRRRPPP